jgi:hypothetical protein
MIGKVRLQQAGLRFIQHPTQSHSGRALRAVRQFAWLGVDSVKVALSRPTWLSSLSRHTSGYPAESMRGLRKPLGGKSSDFLDRG